MLDSATRSIKISDNGASILRLYNKRTGYLVIQKLDKVTKDPLSGVEFELTYAQGGYVDNNYGYLSSKGRFKTNDAGEIRVPVVGTVVIKELPPCPGYVIDRDIQIQTVSVNPAETQTIVMYNEPLCSLTLTKKDAVTGKPVPNMEFTLKDGDGNVLGKHVSLNWVRITPLDFAVHAGKRIAGDVGGPFGDTAAVARVGKIKDHTIPQMLHTEIKLSVVPIAHAGNRSVCNSGPVRAIEQAAQPVVHTIDADIFSGAVITELRQSVQCFPHRAAPPQLAALVPQGIIIQFHTTISFHPFFRNR